MDRRRKLINFHEAAARKILALRRWQHTQKPR
jgi:hypothetical protein